MLTILWRVFNVWSGLILSRNDTLQLLLIVDLVCDWARDVLSFDILQCLSRHTRSPSTPPPPYTLFAFNIQYVHPESFNQGLRKRVSDPDKMARVGKREISSTEDIEHVRKRRLLRFERE